MVPHRMQNQCQYVTKQFAKKITTFQELELKALIGMISGDKDSLCLSVSIHTVTFWSIQLTLDCGENGNYQYSKKKAELLNQEI